MAENKGEIFGISFLTELFSNFILLPFKLIGEAFTATAAVAQSGKNAKSNMRRRVS